MRDAIAKARAAGGVLYRLQTPSGYRHQWTYRGCPTRRVGGGMSIKYGGGWVADWSVTNTTVNALVARRLAAFRGADEVHLTGDPVGGGCIVYEAKDELAA
jgi:hypothetical protein